MLFYYFWQFLGKAKTLSQILIDDSSSSENFTWDLAFSKFFRHVFLLRYNNAQKSQNSILRYECDKVLFRRMRSLSPERSKGDNRIRQDIVFMRLRKNERFYAERNMMGASVTEI